MSDNDHTTEIRTRQIEEKFCTEDGCAFRGDRVVQGVCFRDTGRLVEFAALEHHEDALRMGLEALKERSQNQDDYIASVEANYITAHINWDLTLDECIRLRKENALLKKAQAGSTENKTV